MVGSIAGLWTPLLCWLRRRPIIVLFATNGRLRDLGVLGEVIGSVRRHPREESSLHGWTGGETKHVCLVFSSGVLIQSHSGVNSSFLHKRNTTNTFIKGLFNKKLTISWIWSFIEEMLLILFRAALLLARLKAVDVSIVPMPLAIPVISFFMVLVPMAETKPVPR